MRFLIYEHLCQLNRNLHEAVEILERIRKSPGMRGKPFKEHRVAIEYLRADATQDVLDVMNDIEIHQAARFWKLKRAYEKSIRDPDDVYFEVQDREEERRKQDLPSLIGILRRHIPEPGYENPDEKLEEASSKASQLIRASRRSRKTRRSHQKAKG